MNPMVLRLVVDAPDRHGLQVGLRAIGLSVADLGYEVMAQTEGWDEWSMTVRLPGGATNGAALVILRRARRAVEAMRRTREVCEFG